MLLLLSYIEISTQSLRITSSNYSGCFSVFFPLTLADRLWESGRGARPEDIFCGPKSCEGFDWVRKLPRPPLGYLPPTSHRSFFVWCGAAIMTRLSRRALGTRCSIDVDEGISEFRNTS